MKRAIYKIVMGDYFLTYNYYNNVKYPRMIHIYNKDYKCVYYEALTTKISRERCKEILKEWANEEDTKNSKK